MTVMDSNSVTTAQNSANSVSSTRRNVTRVGFVGLADVAPFFVAKELGLFEKRDLNVVMTREVGWATIRDKVAYGELEAAHALCSLPFSATAGMSSVATPCVSGMVLNRGGDAIVLSSELWKRGVRDDKTLKLDIENRRFFRKYILATVYACSTQTFILRDWLNSAGIDPDVDVELVTLPPSQMCRNLTAGTIDGFCVGDPWASLAISEGIGWSPAVSVDISPNHPEKVLMVSESFAKQNHAEHVALIASLIEACYVCDNLEFRRAIANLISDRRIVNCSSALLEKCLSPEFDYGMGRLESKPDCVKFFADGANRPTASDADWIIDRMSSCSGGLSAAQTLNLKANVFREDVFEQALANADLDGAKQLAANVLNRPVLG